MSTKLTCTCCGEPITGYVCTCPDDNAVMCFQCTGSFLLNVMNEQHTDMATSKEVAG